MIELTIDGIKTKAEEGTTGLEAVREIGIIIPTLWCYSGLSPYGACRLCVVEVVKGNRSSLEESCTLPVDRGQIILTSSERVKKVRKLIIELLVASCPKSKTPQDMAANMGVNKVRFKIKDRGCILCGLCLRPCTEQMRSDGIGFVGRGTSRRVGIAFETKPAECWNCGGCEWICPVDERSCMADSPTDGLCGGVSEPRTCGGLSCLYAMFAKC